LELRSDPSDLPGPIRALLAQIGVRFDADLAARESLADALRRSGLGGTVHADEYGGYAAPPSDRDLALAQEAYERAGEIYFDHPELRELADTGNSFPRVLMRLDAKTIAETGTTSAHVTMRPIDPLIGTRGASVELGTTPLDRRVPPGNWRFSVEISGFGFAECTRYLIARAKPYELDVRVRREEVMCAKLVVVPAGTYLFGDDRPMACDVAGPSAAFEEFWIDPAEISNAQYLAFLADTDHAAPKRWRDVFYAGDWRGLPIGDVDERFLELPATGFNYEDAQAYAEWAGMRLATHVELERALRGDSGLRFPWANSDCKECDGQSNVSGLDVAAPVGECQRFAAYVANTRPVRDAFYFQRALQLFHGFGNVAEYTESLVAEPHDGVLCTSPWERLYLGGMWDADRHNNSLDFHATTGIGERYTKDYVGIRCCRSSTP
jgi:formylglycine-generating enzyme required for sulfatase activity